MDMFDGFEQRGKYWYRDDSPGHAYSPESCEGCGEVKMMRRSKPGKFCSQSCASTVKMTRRWRENPDLWSGSNNGMWKGGGASWSAIHKRVYKERGKASDSPCAFCDDPAYDWAWNNAGDPEDVESFFPACRVHHRRFDVATRMMDQDPAADCHAGWTPSIWV